MRVYVGIRVFVFFIYAVIQCLCNSTQDLVNERHSKVRYLPTKLHQKSTPRPFVHFWETTKTSIDAELLKFNNTSRNINQNQHKLHKKLRKKLKQPKINVTEIVGYLNMNTSRDTQIIKPELNQYNFEQSSPNVEETIKSNLNTLQTIVKNFSCDINNGGCSQFCKDHYGVNKCTCFQGFKLDTDNTTCLDVNECLQENGECSHICVNTYGFHHCVCPKGLRLSDDLKTCEDVNECTLRNGHGPCQDVCKNTFGSYECQCNIKGSRLSADKHNCEDINECVQKTSGCSHGCVNIIGGAICTCPHDMVLQDDMKTCYDPELQNDDMRSCSLLTLPEHGYFQCQQKKPLQYFDVQNDNLIVVRYGVSCTLVCVKGYKTVGDYRITCNEDGDWTGNTTGKCLPILDRKFNPQKNFINMIWAYTKPKITCSPPLLLYAKQNQKLVRVRLRPPKTNVNWSDVRSFPPSAKDNLVLYLPKGHHSVVFEASDSITKLSAKCIISIIIRRGNGK